MEEKGHLCIFYPKFHCELNFRASLVLGEEQLRLLSSLQGLRDNVQKAVASVSCNPYIPFPFKHHLANLAVEQSQLSLAYCYAEHCHQDRYEIQLTVELKIRYTAALSPPHARSLRAAISVHHGTVRGMHFLHWNPGVLDGFRRSVCLPIDPSPEDLSPVPSAESASTPNRPILQTITRGLLASMSWCNRHVFLARSYLTPGFKTILVTNASSANERWFAALSNANKPWQRSPERPLERCLFNYSLFAPIVRVSHIRYTQPLHVPKSPHLPRLSAIWEQSPAIARRKSHRALAIFPRTVTRDETMMPLYFSGVG